MVAWYESKNAGGYRKGRRFSMDDPALTVMADGMGGDSYAHWRVCHDSADDAQPAASGKPSYRVPSMAEVRAVPWNDLTVASLFAGCGGSSLGYRMAGFRVLWANEFVPAAQNSYRANMAAWTTLDGRDVRDVRSDEVVADLAAKGVGAGELDVLDGSPPCQAFSTAGRRARGWGRECSYEGGGKQRNEDMFTEYVRLLRSLRPRAFVAENVSGLVKGVAKGFFLEILAGLKSCGYRVEARILDAQWLGVPQCRQRVIFVGVRDDLGVEPAFPSPLTCRYSIMDACPWIVSARSGPTGFGAGSITAADPAPAISSSGQSPYGRESVIRQQQGAFDHQVQFAESSPTVLGTQANQFVIESKETKRKFTIMEVKRLCSFPDDFILTGSYAQQWERLGNSVPPLMMRAIAEALRDRVLLPARAVR